MLALFRTTFILVLSTWIGFATPMAQAENCLRELMSSVAAPFESLSTQEKTIALNRTIKEHQMDWQHLQVAEFHGIEVQHLQKNLKKSFRNSILDFYASEGTLVDNYHFESFSKGLGEAANSGTYIGSSPFNLERYHSLPTAEQELLKTAVKGAINARAPISSPEEILSFIHKNRNKLPVAFKEAEDQAIDLASYYNDRVAEWDSRVQFLDHGSAFNLKMERARRSLGLASIEVDLESLVTNDSSGYYWAQHKKVAIHPAQYETRFHEFTHAMFDLERSRKGTSLFNAEIQLKPEKIELGAIGDRAKSLAHSEYFKRTGSLPNLGYRTYSSLEEGYVWIKINLQKSVLDLKNRVREDWILESESWRET